MREVSDDEIVFVRNSRSFARKSEVIVVGATGDGVGICWRSWGGGMGDGMVVVVVVPRGVVGCVVGAFEVVVVEEVV